MTVVGACGGGDDDARCVIDGGGDATRASKDVRPSCGPNGARPLFEVGPGGRLTLENVHLSNACNDVDGAGGAVVVRGGDPRGTCVDEGVLESSRNHAVLTMVRSSITRSVAVGAGPGSHGRGGGVALLNKHSLARFTDCTFVDNEAWGGDPGSGAITDYSSSLGNGGGVYVRVDPRFSNGVRSVPTPPSRKAAACTSLKAAPRRSRRATSRVTW